MHTTAVINANFDKQVPQQLGNRWAPSAVGQTSLSRWHSHDRAITAPIIANLNINQVTTTLAIIAIVVTVVATSLPTTLP